MIEIEEIKFDAVSDPIKTEETIYHQIKDLNFDIPYVAFPIAYSINTLGIDQTQNLIDRINQRYRFKKFFVCQHIFVNRINFGGENLVFTPHTEKGDPYYFIPHYNPIYDSPPPKKLVSERKIFFSFIGDFNTSPDRFTLSNFSSDKTIIKPTGKWFFSHDQEKRENLLSEYISVLENTKISLCPRGSGPSTLRLFESMSVGSIPIIFNNLDLPDFTEEFVLRLELDKFITGTYTSDILSLDLQKMSDGIYEAYWNNFSNTNLSNSILKIFK